MMRTLDELHLDHPFMGSRMLRDQLARYGLHAGRRHIRTLMRRMGIEALAPQPGTSQAAPGHKIYPYLLRSWRSPAPWRDNVFVERLWRSVKYERVYLKADGVGAARADIADYLDWYNEHRPHSRLERLTPTEKYLDALPPMKEAA